MRTKTKRKTNLELVTEIMNFSEAGPLKQAFIITAIEKYAKEIVASEPWNDRLISFEAWKACAEEVLDSLEAHYETQ